MCDHFMFWFHIPFGSNLGKQACHQADLFNEQTYILADAVLEKNSLASDAKGGCRVLLILGRQFSYITTK